MCLYISQLTYLVAAGGVFWWSHLLDINVLMLLLLLPNVRRPKNKLNEVWLSQCVCLSVGPVYAKNEYLHWKDQDKIAGVWMVAENSVLPAAQVISLLHPSHRPEQSFESAPLTVSIDYLTYHHQNASSLLHHLRPANLGRTDGCIYNLSPTTEDVLRKGPTIKPILPCAMQWHTWINFTCVQCD